MNIQINEKEILNKIFWPKEKENILGNMIYSNTNSDFTETSEISIVRKNHLLEIAYSSAPTFKPDDKTYFVKIFFNSNESGYITVDKKKSSPELITEEDVKNVLDNISNSILKMNTNPIFFATGVINKLENKNKIIK